MTTTPSSSQSTGRRGRPKGSVSGPRPIIWIGIHHDKEIVDRIYSPKGSVDFTFQEATAAFKAKHGVEPSKVEGPFSDKKGMATTAIEPVIDAQASAPEADIVDDATNLTVDDSMGEAIGTGRHGDWTGLAYQIEGRDDMAYFIPTSNINKPGQKMPAAQALPRSEITFA